MACVDAKLSVFIILGIFYAISIPLTIYWLYAYRIVANTRHKCITSRHFNTTWGYLICCICASNIGHPLSIILYSLHNNVRISIIISSYVLSDVSTFSVCYMCLIRAYMMMWDKQYNLARKEQFWTKKIVNDELETYEINEIENDNSLSPFIKYRRNLGNVKYVSAFMLCILTPITLFITISPFIMIHIKQHQLQHTLSSIFRFVCTIPIVSALVFIYFKIPKGNEVIGLRLEVKAIVQIICGIFLISNLLISFILYSMTQLIDQECVMFLNGNVQMIAAFLLFYTSTGFILPRLNKIIRDDALASNASIPTKRRPFGLSTKLKLLFSWSNHNTNGPNLSSLSIPAFITDPTVSVEKKLKKTLTIWRRRKDMHMPSHKSTANNDRNIYPSTEQETTHDDFSFIDGQTASSFTNNTLHLLQHTTYKDAEKPFDMGNVRDGTEIEEIEEFDDDTEVAHNITDHEIDETEIETEERTKGYSFSKHASTTPAFITPQISKTSDSKPHSRRTSSKFNPSELMNINTNTRTTTTTTTTTNTNTTTLTFSGNANKIILQSSNNSNRSSKQYSMDTPIGHHSNNSNRSTPIGKYSRGRRHSLSVKDAYAGIKQIFGGNRNSMKSSSASNIDDPEEKVYFDIKLEDPLNVVLSDHDGLSAFADHLCSEFNIENLLFLVEVLQYRYCIPMYLFDDNDNTPNIMDIDIDDNTHNSAEKVNKTETVELLMHIIHQNKKLPISKLLKQHRSYCIGNENINHLKHNKNVMDSPSRSASLDHRDGVDFMMFSQEDMIPIRRKSGSRDKIEKCCKECTVEKFKYIIEKYVETTSINLPSATQRKLMHIWNEISINDPEKRFIHKICKIKKKTKKEKQKEIKVNNDKTDKKICTNNDMDRENSKSKSISNQIRKKLKKKSKRNRKSASNNKENKKKEEEEEEKEHKKEEEEEKQKEDKPKQRVLGARQQTMSNTLQSEENTKEQIPSHSVSPRDILMMPGIDVNINNNGRDRCVVASYSNNNTEYDADTPSNIAVSTMRSQHSHNSQASMSHLTSTPITNNTTTTPTECDEEDEEPLPQSPTKKPATQSGNSNEDQQTINIDNIDGMAPTNSMQEMKGNEIWIPAENEVDKQQHEVEDEDEVKEEKEALNESQNESQNEESDACTEPFIHDGFGNINFITVFDDAILEILKLIKSDIWRRFKRTKQFYDWATDFKPS